VGLKHRLADLIDEVESRLHVITDGSLVALAKSDPTLSQYSIIIVDEAHQHTTATDVLLGLLKELVVKRNDLKIVIMSATIDTESFLNFFPGSRVVEVPGRMYPVHINYLEAAVESDKVVAKVIETIVYVHLNGKPGNILVFASGVPQITDISDEVKNFLLSGAADTAGELTIHPLYATLPKELQQSAANTVAPPPRNGQPSRKLIIATNMAETSVTLPGVTHVIDSCRVKSKVFNPEDESYALHEQWISKAQARQRAGRAGRTQEGFAWRMCTETGYHTALTDYTVPEIQNGDMLSECLDIVKIGRDPLKFPFMSPPAAETIVKALGIHKQLGTLTVRNNTLVLTQRGEQVSIMPVNVFSAVAILESMKPELSCCDEIVMLVSMLEAIDAGTGLFVAVDGKEDKAALRATWKKFGQDRGEHIMLFNIYIGWKQACHDKTTDRWLAEKFLIRSTLERADVVRGQVLRLLARKQKFFGWNLGIVQPNDPEYYARILCALASGYFLRVAMAIPGSKLYKTVRQGVPAELRNGLYFRNESSDWVLYDHLASTGLGDTYLRIVTPIPLDLLMYARPEYWCNADFKPAGHILDSLVKRIAELTGCDKSEILVDIEPPPTTQQ
jgi:pre-mRNA-splicing factor ATP-dependent RNA helicase DHX15/PRP43